MERAGAAVVLPDAELTAERLAREVGELLGDQKLRAMGGRRLGWRGLRPRRRLR